jgi:hypothetical protein
LVLIFSASQQSIIGMGMGLPAHDEIVFKQATVGHQYKVNGEVISGLNKALRAAANVQLSEAERLMRMESFVSDALSRIVDRQETLLIVSTHEKGWQLVSAMEQQQKLSGLRPPKQKALASAVKTVSASTKFGMSGSSSFGSVASTSRGPDFLFRGGGQFPNHRGFESGQGQHFVSQRQQRAEEINRRFCYKCNTRGHYPSACPNLYSRSDPNGGNAPKGGGRPSG